METEYFFNTLAKDYKRTHEMKALFYKMAEKSVYARHHPLLNAGHICNHLWFIAQGFAMSYIAQDGKKVPYWFWDEKQVMVPVNSFFKQLPADGFIEILEKSTILSISYDNVQQLVRSFPEFNVMLRSMIEDYHHQAEKRILSLTAISAEERYALLMKESPVIIRKAAVETIATYLGVSRKTLNRIKAKR